MRHTAKVLLVFLMVSPILWSQEKGWPLFHTDGHRSCVWMQNCFKISFGIKRETTDHVYGCKIVSRFPLVSNMKQLLRDSVDETVMLRAILSWQLQYDTSKSSLNNMPSTEMTALMVCPDRRLQIAGCDQSTYVYVYKLSSYYILWGILLVQRKQYII